MHQEDGADAKAQNKREVPISARASTGFYSGPFESLSKGIVCCSYPVKALDLIATG